MLGAVQLGEFRATLSATALVSLVVGVKGIQPVARYFSSD